MKTEFVTHDMINYNLTLDEVALRGNWGLYGHI